MQERQEAFQAWWDQVWSNRLVATLFIMVIVVPFLAPLLEGTFHGTTALFFEGLAILLLATLLRRSRWDLRRERIAIFLRTGANLPVLLFFGLASLSCLCSSHPAYSVQEVLRLGAGVLLYFVAAYQLRRAEHLPKLVDVLILTALVASLIGFIQFAFLPSRLVTATFGNRQLLGSYLMALLPLLVVTAVTDRSRRRALAAQIATVFTTACLMLAFTRSAWIGAIVGLVALALIGLTTHIRHKSFWRHKHEVVLPLMLTSLSIGMFWLVSLQHKEVVQRITTFVNLGEDRTWLQRQQYWDGAVAMIRQHPITGVGIGLYPYYQQEYTGMGLPLSRMGGRASLGEQAHNLYLQTAAELGIPGLLLWVAIPLSFLVKGTRRAIRFEPSFRRSLLVAALGAIVSICVDWFSSPSWHFGQVTLFYWLLLGMGVSSLRSGAAQPERETAVRRYRLNRPATTFATLGLVAMLPTIVLAGDGDQYVIPKKAMLQPRNLTIRGGKRQHFNLWVQFSNGTVENVTYEKGTQFTQLGGYGTMVDTNGRIYQSRRTENSTPTITGRYRQGNVTVAHSTKLFVRYP